MSFFHFSVFRAGLAAFLVAMGTGGSGAAEPAGGRQVILITIDGFPARMFADPKTPVPRIRELAARGVAAEGMRVSTPSVTWPNHTTLVTGMNPARHGVLFNGTVTRGGPDEPLAVDPKRDQKDMVRTPMLFDILHGAGLRTAAIDWPCTRGSKAIDDDFPDTPDTLRHTTPRLLRELVEAGILPDDQDATFRAMTGPARDDIWTRAAGHVLAKRKPHFMVLHLLNTDGTHHRYGPESPASYTALALADFYVGRMIDAVAAAGLADSTAIIVTSDHGFSAVTRTLYPNAILRQAGLLKTDKSNRITAARAQVISEGGLGMIYLNNPATREEDRKKVIELLAGKPGVVGIIEPAEFAKYGLPSPEAHQGMADLLLAPEDACGISGSAAGDDFAAPVTVQSSLGYHGYLGTNPLMNAVFVAAGPGIKRGGKTGVIHNEDVAPTIAHLLGQKIPDADGKVLGGILEEGR